MEKCLLLEKTVKSWLQRWKNCRKSSFWYQTERTVFSIFISYCFEEVLKNGAWKWQLTISAVYWSRNCIVCWRPKKLWIFKICFMFSLGNHIVLEEFSAFAFFLNLRDKGWTFFSHSFWESAPQNTSNLWAWNDYMTVYKIRVTGSGNCVF